MIEANPSIKHHAILDTICRPLKKHDVVFFGYTAVDSDNKAYCLGSKLDYALEYLKSEFVKSDIQHYDGDSVGKYEYTFWDFADLNTSTQNLYKMAADFDQSHTISITRHEKNRTHCYHFSGGVQDNGINERYLQHLDSLHSYIDYFDDCLKNMPELASVYDHPTYVGQQKPLEVQLLTSNPKEIDLVKHGDKTLRFKHFYHYYLTKKERNCLYWLKQGKSVEMIAMINEVSRKTVDRHVSSIKKKFDCYTTFQLGIKIGAAGLADFLLTA